MKIFFAVPHSGCAYWRCHQPADMITKLGLAEVRCLDENNVTAESAEEMMNWCDVMVQQSPMGINMVAGIVKYKELGKTVIGDYDDLTFACSPFNPAYKCLGLNEVKIKKDDKEEFLWEDEKKGFSIKANYFRYKSLQDLLGLFHGVTTTNRVIKNVYSEWCQNIFILPNSIDFNLFKPFPKRDNSQVRIGWTASDSHYSEIWMVKRIMRKIFNKYGDKVKFVELGNLAELQFEFTPKEMEMHAFIGLSTYPIKLAALNLDIAICPLDNSEFNRAKSQLKWSEFSSIKVPSVCSKLEPYECVEDGDTGMLAKDDDEFFNKLCELIDNKELREKIASNAYDKNYEDFNLEKNAVLWVEAYEQARDSCNLPVLDKGQLVRDIPKI